MKYICVISGFNLWVWIFLLFTWKLSSKHRHLLVNGILCDCKMLENILCFELMFTSRNHICFWNLIWYIFLCRHLTNVWSYVKLTVTQRTCGCKYHSFVVMLLNAGMCTCINLDCSNFHYTTFSSRLKWFALSCLLYMHAHTVPISCKTVKQTNLGLYTLYIN